MNPRIAIMASGSGSTAEAFIRAGQAGEITSRVGLVIVSRSDAGIFDRIDKLNKEFGLSMECVLVNSKTHPVSDGEEEVRGRQTKAEEQAIIELIEDGGFDLVASMGYMKLNGPKLVHTYGWRPEYSSIYQAKLVNTHPGLLPDTKAMYGLNIQAYILEHGLPYGGQTLHLAGEDYDDGPILAEHRVEVKPGDTAEELFERVQATEKKYLPGDIEAFVLGRIAYTKSQ